MKVVFPSFIPGRVRELSFRQLVRFGIVGALNTAFGYGIYCAFLYIGFNYIVASLLSLCAGILWSFVTNGKLVFQSQLKGRFPRYVALWLFLYVSNVAAVGLLIKAGISAYTAGLLTMAPMILIAFLLQRYLVFAQRNSGS